LTYDERIFDAAVVVLADGAVEYEFYILLELYVGLVTKSK
jgi:hypothetical protein